MARISKIKMETIPLRYENMKLPESGRLAAPGKTQFGITHYSRDSGLTLSQGPDKKAK